jgi:hypothetical protein
MVNLQGRPPLLHDITKTPRLVVFGGYPIAENRLSWHRVSGGHYSHDMQVAEAVAALGSVCRGVGYACGCPPPPACRSGRQRTRRRSQIWQFAQDCQPR